MAVVHVPSDFWPNLSGVGGNGVQFATPSLFIANGVISIATATDNQSGCVTDVAQPFGGVKDFVDGLSIAGGNTMTAISTDTTFAAAADTKLATQLAIKTYVDNSTIVDTVSNPLYLNGS